MHLRAQLKFAFNRIDHPFSFVTATYEPASFDQYLLASLALHAKDQTEALAYLDGLTGEGSLNDFFKKKYPAIASLSKENLTKILANSLYPVQKVNEGHHVYEYPDLKTIYVDHKIASPTVIKDDKALGDALVYSGELVSISRDEPFESNSENSFVTTIDDDDIKIQFLSGEWIKLPKSVFEKTVVKENPFESLDNGEAQASSAMPDGACSILTAAVYRDLNHSKLTFFEDGSFYFVGPTGLTKTILGKELGLYLYHEDTIAFKEIPTPLADKAIEQLFEAGEVRRYPANSLISLLFRASKEKIVETINWIAPNEAKDIGPFIIKEIRNGLIDGWNNNALQTAKTYAEKDDLTVLYANCHKIFSLPDLLQLDPSILNEEDKKIIAKHESDRAEKIAAIKTIYGDITASSLREDSKKLENDKEVKRFRFLVNNNIAHNKTNLRDLSDEALDKQFKDAIELKSLVSEIQKKLDKIAK
jgi:hypothetical protein